MTGVMDRFFDLTLAMLCTARRDGNAFENLNPAWERTLSWTREELTSKSFIEFIHPDDVQPTFDIIAKMDDGAPAVHFENRYRHKDGSWVWLSWVSVLVGGTYYAAAIDVTPYKDAAEKLGASNAELRHFAYSASHDLREPLRGILGHLALIDGSSLDPASQESLRHVRSSAEQMQRLLDGLLAYSRITTGAGTRAPTSMAAVVQDAAGQLARAAEEAGATIQTEGAMPILAVDAAQMLQVVQNLLANAIKFRRPDRAPRITVRCREEDRGWRFEVVDDGVGFDPRHAERAFLIFQRLHPASQYPGSGIGLALVRRIVQNHQGRTGIASTPGEGTAAWFWLPR